jgi:hypothetical protein
MHGIGTGRRRRSQAFSGNSLEHRLVAAMHAVELRSLGVIAALLSLFVAIIKLV